MAQTESKIKLIFEGAERGVVAAALKSKAAIKSVNDENDRLGKAGSKAESALMGIGKGLLAVSSAGSAVSVIGGVAAAAAQASGALLLLPGALAAVKIGLGAIDMGAGDFLSAMGNLNDNKAFSKNMLAMGDSAKGVAGQIKIAHDSLAEGLGEKMFAGIEDKIKPLIASTLPQLKASYDSIAVSVNRTGHEILDMLNKSSRQADLNKLIQDSGAIWDQLLQSVAPLSGAFLDIAVVGSQAIKEMTGGIGDAAKRFADFIAKARASGQIRRWIDSGVQAFKDMWTIVKNVGSTIGSVFKGLGLSMGSPLAMLRDLTTRMAEFMQSAAAQEGLQTLGHALKTIGEVVGWVAQTALRQLAETLVAVAPVAETVAKTFGVLLVGALNVLGPVIRGIADFLAAFPAVTVIATTALVGFVVAMKTIKTVNAVADLLGIGDGILGIGKKAETAGGKVEGFKGKLGLLKGVAAGLALGAVVEAMDSINASSEQGNLSGWNGELHDIQRIMTGDWGNPLADISRQLDQMSGKWSAGQAPVQQWSRSVGTAATTAATSMQNFFRGLVGLPPLPPVKLDVDPTTGQAHANEFVGGVSRMRGTAHIDAEASRGNNVLAGWKGSANATVGQAHVAAEASKANGAVSEWKDAAGRTWGTVHANADTRQAVADLARLTQTRYMTIEAIVRTRALPPGHSATGGAVTGGKVAQRFGYGGGVTGPGSGTSDSVPALLSNGEWVSTAAEVKAAGGFKGMQALSDALSGRSSMRASARSAMRTPTPRSSSPSGGAVVQFAGNTSDALATVIMGMIRQGKIQIKAA